MRAHSFILYLSLTFTFLSCHKEVKFDRQKWILKHDFEYPYRNAMVNDLVKNHQIKGLAYSELVKFLGEPEKNMENKNNEIYYEIETEYRGIDPGQGKLLIIKIDSDSIVTDFVINKWGN